ncbi:Stalked cell differentiation-controlling protein [Variovorax sp. SRS16]|nr:Stalked cell differentiation-controlling protein [Variovorax sp. SRS16]
MSMHVNAGFEEGGADRQQATTVLLVDDQPLIAMVVGKMLSVDSSIAFHACANASEALATACKVHPTVILQDLVMPGADGLDLVRAYRSTPQTRNVPIIVLSSNDEPIMKKSAFAIGANDYLVKLPEPIELVARIRYHSRSYMALIQRDNAYRALRLSEQQLLESNQELRRLTNSDGLTGLSNRRFFDEYMAQEWKASLENQSPLSLLMIDVDCFKNYNDRLGHLAGDDALRRVASAIRETPCAPPAVAARFGGEEFALVLPSLCAADAEAVAQKLRADIEALALPHPASDGGPCLTVSIGVATTTAMPGSAPDRLIQMADARLYEAKSAGRNRVVGGGQQPGALPQGGARSKPAIQSGT